MKLTVLGSGCLLPVPGRGNSGYLLQTENHHILIDGGSGTLRRMADFGLNYRHIDYIVYTHLHPDHTLDDGISELIKGYNIIRPNKFANV